MFYEHDDRLATDEEEPEEDKKAKDEGGSPPFGRLDCLSLLINKPDRPVKIKFTKVA